MSRTARAWFAANAAVVVIALMIQIPITAGRTGGFFDTPAERVGNLFTFFTIQTNLIVAGTSLLLAIDPGRASTAFRALRLDALIGIVITGVIYHAVLSGLHDLRGLEEVANQLLHTVSPLLMVGGWALFGPRGGVRPRVVAWSLAFPLAWVAFTLVRGAVIGWYPYPFMDVIDLGYAAVAVNCGGVTVLFLALAAVAAGTDRLLSRGARATVTVSET